MASLQQHYYETLMARALSQKHVTPGLLNRIEGALATPEQTAGYVAMLIDKVDSAKYPSGQLMDRVDRMMYRVATA
jgi:hypothetical protein